MGGMKDEMLDASDGAGGAASSWTCSSPSSDPKCNGHESDATASVDWEPAPSLKSNSHFSVPVKITASPPVPLTRGRAKIQRELKEVGPYGTHRQRISKIVYIALKILFGLFLLNAVIVSLSLWQCSRLRPDEVNIRRVELYDLERDTARASVAVDLPQRWFLYLFNVVLHAPTVITIYAPDAIRNDEEKWNPLAVISVPRFSLGRFGTRINLTGIPIRYGSFPLSEVIEYFSNFRSPIPRRVSVRVEFEVETTSYWLPIRFKHAVEQTIEVPEMDMSSQSIDPAAMPVLEAIEFPREGLADETTEFAINFHIGYPRRDIPEYVYVQIPEFFIDVGYFTDVRTPSTFTSGAIGRVKLLPHLLSGSKEVSSAPAIVQLVINEARKDALAGLLGKVREGDFSWSLAIGIDPQSVGDRPSHLQRWLTALSYDMSIEKIAKQLNVPLNRLVKRDEESADTENSIPALKAGLVEIDGRKNYPRAVFRFSVDNHYLQSLFNAIPLPKIKGSVPQLTIKAMIDKTAAPPIEIFNIDLVYLHSNDQLKFLLYTGILDISTVVKAVNKVAHNKILSNRKEDDDSLNYNSVFLHVAGDRILDKLLRVFEIQFALSPGGGFTFRHGSRRPLKQFVPESIPEIGPMARAHRQKMRHDVNLDVTSSTETIRVQGGINLHKVPAVASPFVHIFWNAVDLAIFPEEIGLQHVELLHASITGGSMHLSLDPTLDVLQRFHHGAFDFELAIRHSDEIIDGVPALIAGWRHLAMQFVQPEVFARIHMVGRIGNHKIDIPSCLPSRAQLFMANTDVPRWVTDVIKTRVKIAGFTDAVLQVLLELPSLGHCKASKRHEHDVAVGLQVALPALHANGCLYPKVHGKERISCVTSVGLHPLIVGLELFDGEFCDIKTRLAKPEERVYKRKVAEYDVTHDHLLHEHRERPAPGPPSPELFLGDEEGTLINYLPLSAAITDLKRGLQAADKLAGAKRLKYLKTSLGFSDRKALLAKESSSLLDRLINGVGQSIPLVLPLYSRKKRPARPPLSRFYKGKPMKVHVDVHSHNSNTLKGRLICRLPDAVLPSTRRSKAAHGQSTLALLLAVQWGRTLISLQHGDSWLKVRVSQGQATFRLDKNRVRLGRHSGIPFTRNVIINFALHTDARNFSSATLRRVLARLHDYGNRRAGDRISRHIMKKIPSKRLELFIRTLPFQIDPHEARIAKQATARRRAVLGKESVLRQHLRLSTIVEMVQRLMRHLKHRSGPKLDYQMIIKPQPYKHKRTYRLPCFIPSICDPEELNRPSPKKKLMLAELSLLNVVQPIMNLASLGLGLLLDKVNFRRHPKYLAVSVRVSRLRLAMAINDIDVVEVEIDPIHVMRVSKIIYPQDGVQHLSLKRLKRHDVQVIVAHIKLARRLQDFSNLLRPFNLDASMAINIDPVPKFMQHGHRVPVHYSHLNVALTTEHVHRTTMLSTLVAMGMPETAVGPMISSLGKGAGVKINILRTSRDGMHMKISGVSIPNPLPFAAIAMDSPVSASYVYKGIEFARVKLGHLTLTPGDNPVKAHVMVSRSAFGKLRTRSLYIPELSEFLAGLALAQPLKVSAVIHIGRRLHLRTHLSFKKGVPAMGAFNPKNSYVDFRDAHEILRVGKKLPQAAWYVAKTAGKRLTSDLGGMWGKAKNWLGSMYTWAKTKLWGDGKLLRRERQLPARGRQLRRRDYELLRSERRRLFPRALSSSTDDDSRPTLRHTRRRRGQEESDSEADDSSREKERAGDDGIVGNFLKGVYSFATGFFKTSPTAKKRDRSLDPNFSDEDTDLPRSRTSRRRFSSEESSEEWISPRSKSQRTRVTVRKSTLKEKDDERRRRRDRDDGYRRDRDDGYRRDRDDGYRRDRDDGYRRDRNRDRDRDDDYRRERDDGHRRERDGGHRRDRDDGYRRDRDDGYRRDRDDGYRRERDDGYRRGRNGKSRATFSREESPKRPSRQSRDFGEDEEEQRPPIRHSSRETREETEWKKVYRRDTGRESPKEAQVPEERRVSTQRRHSKVATESSTSGDKKKQRPKLSGDKANTKIKKRGITLSLGQWTEADGAEEIDTSGSSLGRWKAVSVGSVDDEANKVEDGEIREQTSVEDDLLKSKSGKDKSDTKEKSRSSKRDSEALKDKKERSGRRKPGPTKVKKVKEAETSRSGKTEHEQGEDDDEPELLRDDEDGGHDPELDIGKLTGELVLDDGKVRTEEQRERKLKSVEKRLESPGRRREKCKEKFNEEDPNGDRKISHSWQKKLKAADAAAKAHHKSAKRGDFESRSDSTPSNEIKFDQLLHQSDHEPKKRHKHDDRKMTALFKATRKESLSDERCQTSVQRGSSKPASRNNKGVWSRPQTSKQESSSNDDSWSNSFEKGKKRNASKARHGSNKLESDSGGQKSKKLYARALHDSESDEDSSSQDSLAHRPEKSWGEMWKELKRGGHQVYAHLLKNFQKGYYHIAFNNEHDFVVMISGMILNLEFLDKEGRFYSSVATALQTALGPLRGRPLARVQLAPKPCYKEGLDNAAFLRCVDKNVMKSPAVLPPKFEMRKGDTVKACSTLPNYQAIPQLIDQMVYRDGMCVAVRPSLVSTALARPNAPRGERPFLMHLLVTMDDMEQPTTPFSDPCHKSVECLPQDHVLLLPSDRLIKQASALSASQRKGPSKSKKVDGSLEHVATTRFFNRHPVHPRSNLLISFKFRLSYVSRFASLMAGPERSGWSLIFKVGRLPKLSHRADYGYQGVTSSVALVFDPQANSLAIHRDGSLTPLMSKKASPAPPELSHDQLHQVLVQYRPADKTLAVAISTVDAPEHRFLSVFPVDIPELLLHNHEHDKMHIGMGMATAGYAVTGIKDFQLQVVLPNLSNTRVYYIDNYSVTAHQRGRFLLELRDSCNKIIAHSTVPVSVKLYPVHRSHRHSQHHRSDSQGSLAAEPDRRSVPCTLKAYPQYGVYLVSYKAYQPGTYNVLVSYKLKPKHHEGRDPIIRGKWHRIKYYQVYVKNVW